MSSRLRIALVGAVVIAAVVATYAGAKSTPGPAARPSGPSAACPTGLEEVGRFGGYTTAFTTAGRHAYIGIGRSVRIVDLGPASDAPDPTLAEGTELREVSSVSLPDEASHLAVVSGTLLVALGDRREMQAFDVRDPAAPRAVGSVAFPGDVRALAAQWPFAFVGLPYRLLTVDITDPARMAVLRDTPVPQLDIYHWFVLHDGLVFAPGGGMDASGSEYVRGLRVLDVHDPLAVRDLGGVEVERIADDSALTPHDLAFVGDVGYVAAFESGVRTYDFSDPLHPEPLGNVDTPRGGLHYVVSDGSFAYGLGDSDSVYVADVRDPSRPVHLRIVAVPGEGIRRPALDGRRLSLASDGAIHVMDVADPPTVTLRAAFHTLGTSEGGIAARDGRAYVGSVEGLRSVDVRDPARPRDDGGVLERFPPSAVQIVGSRAYVVGGYFVCCGTVSILDLADPERPRTLGTVSISGNPTSVAVAEPYLFVSSVDSDLPPATRWDGVHLRMYDVTDPATPGAGGEIPHAGALANVAGLVYVFDGELLRILDVAPDGSPITVSTRPFPHRIFAIQVVGDRLYAAETARLHVLDVRDPRAPVVVGAVDGIGGYEMAADGACLFALRDPNVQVIALDDPDRPRVVETVRGIGGLGGPNGLAADEGRLYLASQEQGLTILAPAGSVRPTAPPTMPVPTATPWAYHIALPLAANMVAESASPRLNVLFSP